ncbi:hypothetical protein [Streptomyces collinus]|uniref:hypothetical protein n=1 Tax=Streptomyces collinus TaxID=42684 RepID=UPI0036913502
MPDSERNSESDAVRRARAVRMETVRDLVALMHELRDLHDEMVACENDEEHIWDLLQTAGAMVSVWLDDVACRFADTDHDADELFAIAWRLLDDLALAPEGFRSQDDATLFTTLRGSAAALLAKIWINGYLLSSIPRDAWPNQDLILLLLRALEHHADAVALTDALDHREGRPRRASPPTSYEKSVSDDKPSEPEP